MQYGMNGFIILIQECKKNRPQSELHEHAKTIEEYFREHPPATINEARALIEELTGIQRGLTQIRKFVKSLGKRLLKTGSLPAKADVEQQNAFVNEQLKPRLKEAHAGKRNVFLWMPLILSLACFQRCFGVLREFSSKRHRGGNGIMCLGH